MPTQTKKFSLWPEGIAGGATWTKYDCPVHGTAYVILDCFSQLTSLNFVVNWGKNIYPRKISLNRGRGKVTERFFLLIIRRTWFLQN